MQENEKAVHHKILFDDRKTGMVTGVTDVISFDDKEICLKTCAGNVTVQGSSLTLTRLDLDKGETDIQGTVERFFYSRSTHEKNKTKKKYLRRWFS